MIYAKCIHSSQIAKTREEFARRQMEEYCVYCEGETTYSHNDTDTLDCVPLNYIYDCLKYGDHIAIVSVESEDENYPTKSSYLSVQLSMSKQHIIKIMKADSKDAIDYVFDNVNNRDIIHDGYLNFLSDELVDYFVKRKEGLLK
ncbi:MAG: hypothetical protein IJD68_05630 [Ruminococcus sp.]|nr:hypothetical protein [Ruminococcus sp.]